MLIPTENGRFKFVPRPKNQRHAQGPLFIKGPTSAAYARMQQADAIALLLEDADRIAKALPPGSYAQALLLQGCEQLREAFKLRAGMRGDRVSEAIEAMIESKGARAVYRARKAANAR